MRPVIGFVLLAGVVAASVQKSLSTPFRSDSERDDYQFDWPIRRVAVIGAGPSGLAAYKELTEAGLDVRLFERDSVPGGVWHYTEDLPLDAPVPNAPAPIGDFVPSFPPAGVDLPYTMELEDDGEIWRDHSGPKKVWESLGSNMPSPMQELRQWPWPVGTPWELSHYQIRNYFRAYASFLNINSNDENSATSYNTRVERVEKRVNQAGKEQGWRLWLRSLEPTPKSKTYRATWWTEDFDAVVVASGRFNAPSIPFIPGLQEWVRRFPGRVHHSRQYRRPQTYTNQTVLVVGAGVSGIEICRDINRHAVKTYHSFRVRDMFTLSTKPDSLRDIKRLVGCYTARLQLDSKLRRIPKNATLVGEIERFLPIPTLSSIQSGHVKLKNGTILTGIDSVILATGYQFSFPFLPQYYDGATYEPHEGSSPDTLPFLPLTGSYIRDLYLDQFYIRDPTLAFLGIVPTFLSMEHTTLALAKVWTNTAKLPSSEGMWAWYDMTMKERGGYGKTFLSFSPEQTSARIMYLTGWLNEAAYKYGGKQIDGIPEEYKEISYYWQIVHFGGPVLEGPNETLASLAESNVDQRWHNVALFYDDDW